MITLARSRRERLLLALTVVIAGLVGGDLFVLEPVRERNRHVADIIPAREERLERRQLLIAQRSALEAELGAVSGRLDAESARLLQGPTPPLAAAELQKLIEQVAGRVGVEVRSERMLPVVDKGGFQEVPVEITVAGGIRECLNLMFEMERMPKLLTVRELKVRVVSAGQPRDLLTTISVSGFLLSRPIGTKPGDKAAAPVQAGASRG